MRPPAYACAGQWSTSTSRLIVVEEVYDEFVERLHAQVQLDGIMRYIAIGRDEGAEVLTGGVRLSEDGLDRGCFIAPTVFTGVTPEMRIGREEIFGPVLS